MKDFISKLTFGFLMAQFVPGAIAVCSIAFLCAAFTLGAGNSLKLISSEALKTWLNSVPAKITFVAMCTGAGMLIHGIHWAVLSYLETFFGTIKDGKLERKPICEMVWHKLPIFLQVLLGPLIAIFEILAFFLTGTKISNLATHENVPKIDKDKMESFNFIQDFYLHFAQFYAHTSYAFLISLISLIIFIYFFGVSKIRIYILIITYILTGLFFVIGRIQLTTLFIAEREMLNNNCE